MSNYAPIVLFVFNRPEHTRETIDALRNNTLAPLSDLYIFSDSPREGNLHDVKGVEKVRDVVSEITGFKSVTCIYQNENKGLSQSVIDGVSWVLSKHESVIVLEDDLVTSPAFLKYMNYNLTKYKTCENVASIHGYIYPIDNLPSQFFIRGADCWGWATWRKEWSDFEANGAKLFKLLVERKLGYQFNFNDSYDYMRMLKDQVKGKNSSWAIRWYAANFLLGKLTLYPGKSYVRNIGNDDTGTHSKLTNCYDVEVTDVVHSDEVDTVESQEARKLMINYFENIKPGLIKRLIHKVREIFSAI